MKPLFLVVSLVVLLLIPASAAQKKNQKGPSKTPSKAEATKTLTTAKKDLRDAQTAQGKAARALATVRATASAKHQQASGAVSAQKKLQAIAGNLEVLRRAVSRRVRATSAHAEATAAAKEAGEQLRDLSRQPKLGAERKKQLRGELSAIVRRPVEIDTTLSGLTSLIEPLLIVFLGVTIGGIVICMFMPIFKMSDIINR